MLLESRFAIVYGAGGALGSTLAANLAREGACVFLTGRTREPLEQVAQLITGAGGRAEVDVVDALDEQAVDAHARSVVARAGAIDASVNLLGRPDPRSIPLLDLTVADFVRSVTLELTTTFITARAAARQMTRQGSGVILVHGSGSVNGTPVPGGSGPVDGAIEVFVRNLAAEVGPAGVRVVGIWTTRLPGQVPGWPSRRCCRAPTLVDLAEAMTLLASDRAGAITATFIERTAGGFAG